MPEKDSKISIINKIETLRGAELSDEEYAEIDEWNKGRALAQLVIMPGWQVVLEMLAQYPANSTRKLLATDPVNKDEVTAEHAVAFAANRIYNCFMEDVQRAVIKARQTPNIIKDELRKVSPAPPESMF